MKRSHETNHPFFIPFPSLSFLFCRRRRRTRRNRAPFPNREIKNFRSDSPSGKPSSALRERDDGRGRSVLHDLGESDEGHDSLLEVGHLEGLEMEAGGPDGFWGRCRDFICHEVERGGGDMGVRSVM